MNAPNPSPGFQARAKRFWYATHGPTFRATYLALGTGILLVVVTLAVLVLFRDARLTVVTVVVAGAIAVAVTLLPYRHEPSRLAAELVRDHECREAQEWKALFGAALPRSPRGRERWLEEHPRGPGRIAILTGLGRLDEADHELDAREVTSPEERFESTLQRAMIAMFRGREPDIALLRAGLAEIPDPRRQAARRQCIVGLQAWQAADRGEDALAVLARGRRVIGILDPASRIERQMLRLVTFPLLVAGGVVVGIAIGMG